MDVANLKDTGREIFKLDTDQIQIISKRLVWIVSFQIALTDKDGATHTVGVLVAVHGRIPTTARTGGVRE